MRVAAWRECRQARPTIESDDRYVHPDRGANSSVTKSSVMTQSVTYFGIGVFVAALLGLLVVVHVHYRGRLGSADQFRADIRQVEQQLAGALAERSKLQREIAAIKRDAEKTWTTERIESALFRERINDVADEVARVAHILERPSSLIEPVSGYVALMTGTKRQTEWLAIDSAGGEASVNTGVLADRIRALRTMASRADVN
jgi:chorismate mutase